jgi:hypothetical protein
MTPTDDSYDLNLAAAALRSNSTDLRLLLKALSQELADTLGDRLRVQRGGGRFKKSDVISSLQINLANNQFEAVMEGSDLRCTIGRFSGGIRIRNETVDVNVWILKLLEALQAEAAHSDSARQALENLVIGGST